MYEKYAEKKAFVTVSELCNIIKDFLGADKGITAERVNIVFNKIGFQELIDDDEIKYRVTDKYSDYATEEFSKRDTGYRKYTVWSPQIIEKLFSINTNQNVEKNMVEILKKIKLISLDNINFITLENSIRKKLEEKG